MIEVITVYGLDKFEDIQSVKEEYINDMPQQNVDSKKGMIHDTAYHAIVYDNKRPVAIGRLMPHYEIDEIYVLKNYRKNYYGDVVVKVLLDKGFSLGANEITANVPKAVTKFFEKIGFYVNTDKVQEESEWIYMGIRKENIIKCKK